jgi:hypothetical protein
MEEYYRWLCVLACLWLLSLASVPHKRAGTIALVVSAAVFSVGHLSEFSSYRLLAFAVFFLYGVVLAALALWGCFFAAVTVHVLYDVFSFGNLWSQFGPAVYGAAALGLMLLIAARLNPRFIN